jgi:3-hydroxy-9,10-secoandrosta-1,3,5(10)-triene-9,17-dione monooxygenase
MTIIESPPRTDMVRRATELIPLIRKHAEWHEENRRLHDEVLEGLDEAGILKMRVPVRYGGTVPDMETVVNVISELARGDGCVGWTTVSFTIASWMASLLPDEVQDEVFAEPGVRLCGSVGMNGIAVPTKGGYILNGEWHFNTGSPHAQWDTHACLLAKEDGSYEPAIVVVPMSSLKFVDDWHVSGLRGTGSATTIAQDLFVPEEWLLNMIPVAMHSEHASVENAKYQAWRVPFLQFAITVASAPGLGMARHGLETFLDRIPNRAISNTHYQRQIEAPITHLQVGEAAAKIDEAEYHLYRQVKRLDTKSMTGEPWTLQEKALARLDAGLVVGRGQEAVGILAAASGASSIYNHVPIQRIDRDIRALALHGIMQPSTNLETYGRVLCGLEPNTDYM